MTQSPSPIVDEVAEALLNALTKIGGLATATVIRVDGVPRPFAWDRLAALGEISAALTQYAALAPPPKEAKAEHVGAEVVAWRVKDYADGWIYHTDEARARRVADHMSGALVQPLYASPQPSSVGGEGSK